MGGVLVKSQESALKPTKRGSSTTPTLNLMPRLALPHESREPQREALLGVDEAFGRHVLRRDGDVLSLANRTCSFSAARRGKKNTKNGVWCPPLSRDPYIIHLNIALSMVVSPYFGVEQATCFKWLQNVSFKEPCSVWRNGPFFLSAARRV